jgi:putative ABC transport system permease protein
MSWIHQIFAVTALNLRSIPQRLGASLVAIIGVAAVVGVFAGVLSMASGFRKTMIAAGATDTAVILRAGSTGEMASAVSSEQIQIISTAPGVRSRDGTPEVSGELYVVVDVDKKSTDEAANVPLRGVQTGAFGIRDNLSIIEGRQFETGKNELVVGRNAQRQFVGLNVGDKIPFGVTEWTVVGVFEDDGSASESELWADVRVVQAAYRRGNSFQTVRAKLNSPQAIEGLRAALDADPRIDVDVVNEREFYSQQSEAMTDLINFVGYPLTILMSIGAIFGALNTMYSSISARSKEIATLRAIGFRPLSILVSVIIESGTLAIIGGLIGGGLAWLFLNGYTVSTLNAASFSQVVFDFAVSADLILQGLVAAAIIGLVGGLFPAIRAVRVPVVEALREL